MIHRLAINELGDLLVGVVQRRKPYSMIRLGDGEYAVIRYPKHTSRAKLLEHVGRWFTTDSLNEKQLHYLSRNIARACRDADLLGIPSRRELRYIKWHGFDGQVERLGLEGKRYFHFYLMTQLYIDGWFDKMLRGLDRLFCITCRPVAQALQQRFDVGKVFTLHVPPERFRYHRKNSGLTAYNERTTGGLGHHFDVCYQQVHDFMQSIDLRGQVFLVGAGGLGKVYCMWAKQRGAVALDVGALFDGWAGLTTRPYLKEPERFTL